MNKVLGSYFLGLGIVVLSSAQVLACRYNIAEVQRGLAKDAASVVESRLDRKGFTVTKIAPASKPKSIASREDEKQCPTEFTHEVKLRVEARSQSKQKCSGTMEVVIVENSGFQEMIRKDDAKYTVSGISVLTCE